MSQFVETAIDKFKVDETSPFFPIGSMAPTGSYGNFNSGLRNEYVLKFKNNETKSVIRTSGIVGSNLNTVPPTTPPITILWYSNDLDPPGSSFEWSGVTWTFDGTLPNYSYFATATQVIQPPPNASTLISVAIGTSVTSIGLRAFGDCSGLISITIPNSVTSIGNYAFYGCTNLTSIIIPDSVTSIGNGAFQNCTSFTSITIPNLVTSISNTLFSTCTSLTSITIPNSVTSIGDDAFSNCTSLPSIIIPITVTSIGDYAFSECTSLSSITIPNSVTSIGENAFINSELAIVTISNNQLPLIPSPALGVDFYGRTVTTILPLP